MIDFDDGLYFGADGLTNNTAELSGCLHTLRWIKRHSLFSQTKYDSTYAADTAQSMLRPKLNLSLVLSVRAAFQAVQSSIVWRKAAAHTSLVFNERADALALCGACGLSLGCA